MARSPRCPSQGKGGCRCRVSVAGQDATWSGNLGLVHSAERAARACRCPLKRTTFGLARPDTMEHVEKVRPQLLSLRQAIMSNL